MVEARAPREQAVEFLDLLLIEAASESDFDVVEAWGREIDRRLAEFESGMVQSTVAEQVMAEVRKVVGRGCNFGFTQRPGPISQRIRPFLVLATGESSGSLRP